MNSAWDCEMLTVQEFAERLKVGRSTVFNWLKEGLLCEGEHFLILPGGQKRFPWSKELLESISYYCSSSENDCNEPQSLKAPNNSRINLNL